MRQIDPLVTNCVIYGFWLLLCGLMNFAGSMGLFHVLKYSSAESKSPGNARKTAFSLAICFSVLIALPWLLPTGEYHEQTAWVGFATGILFCYALLGMQFGCLFPLPIRSTTGQPAKATLAPAAVQNS